MTEAPSPRKPGAALKPPSATSVAFVTGALVAAVLVALLPAELRLGLGAPSRPHAWLLNKSLPLLAAAVDEQPYVARHRAHRWSLADEGARRRGVKFTGSGSRLDRFAAKLVSGQPVKVVALGGSVTVGVGSMDPPKYGYPGQFALWLNTTFPHPRHEVINRGVGATTSGLFALCTHKMVPQDVDLVVIEFSFNDPHWTPFVSPARKGFEQLLRKLLRLSSHPAVVLMHFYSWWSARLTEESRTGGIFWKTGESQLGEFGEYYDVPSVSLRSAAYHKMRRGEGSFKVDKVLVPSGGGLASPEGGKPGESFYFDIVHPTDFGYGVMSDLLVELVMQAVERVASRRSGQQAAAARAARGAGQLGQPEREVLPPPMVPDNIDTGASACFIQEDFKSVVAETSGFSWVAARPQAPTFVGQKWAWTGTAPGAWAELVVDSRETPGAPAARKPGSAPMIVILGYLRSYESMGAAKVECVAGCACPESRLEGTWERRATMMEMQEFQVSQHRKCRLRVTVLPETKSGGHKISLTFVMVSAFPIARPEDPRARAIVGDLLTTGREGFGAGGGGDGSGSGGGGAS